MSTLAGNTIQLTVQFLDLDGVCVEVTNPVTTVYNYETQIGTDINISYARQGPGLYIFKYTIPVGIEGEVTFVSIGLDNDSFPVKSELEILVTTEQYNALLTRNSDKIRFLVQDTDENDLILQNSEINVLFAMCGNSIYATAIALCDVLAAKVTKLATRKELGDFKVQYMKKAEEYVLLKKMFKMQLTLGSIPYIGGLSRAELNADKTDTDLIQPKFTKDMEENYRMGESYTDNQY